MSYALITGASKGIGKALAEQLAAQKYNLLLVARSENLLKEQAAQMRNLHGIHADYLALDLTSPSASSSIANWIEQNNFPLTILINNAGYGMWGKFNELNLDAQNDMINVNVYTVVNLTYRLIPFLLKQEKSYIMNVGSTAAAQAVPTLSVYSASKAFITNFTRGLRHELKGTPISVTLLTPGSTSTNFVEQANMQHMEQVAEKFSMTPEKVATIALSALFSGKAEAIPGVMNKLSVASARIFPKGLVEKAAGNIYKKK
jgi:uncharacterized protein